MSKVIVRIRPSPRTAVMISTVMVACLVPHGGEAQSDPGSAPPTDAFLGYVVNLPEQHIGFTYGRIRDQAWGFFIDVKVSAGVPGSASADYYEDITTSIADALGHTPREEKTGYFSLNTGPTRRLGSRLAVYAGVGLCAVQPFRRYHDPSLLFGQDGEYWIDGAEQAIRVNLMLGALFAAASNIQVQMGFETLPAGLTIGLGWILRSGA